MYPFYYEVEIDSYDFNEDNKVIVVQRGGILFAETYVKAMDIIQTYFGNELIAVTRLEAYGESSLISIPVEKSRQFKPLLIANYAEEDAHDR